MEGCRLLFSARSTVAEFVPHDEKGQQGNGRYNGKIKQRVEDLHEQNPMWTYRGCRLGNTFPEITEMQTLAISGCSVEEKGIKAIPSMVPFLGILSDLVQNS